MGSINKKRGTCKINFEELKFSFSVNFVMKNKISIIDKKKTFASITTNNFSKFNCLIQARLIVEENKRQPGKPSLEHKKLS